MAPATNPYGAKQGFSPGPRLVFLSHPKNLKLALIKFVTNRGGWSESGIGKIVTVVTVLRAELGDEHSAQEEEVERES